MYNLNKLVILEPTPKLGSIQIMVVIKCDFFLKYHVTWTKLLLNRNYRQTSLLGSFNCILNFGPPQSRLKSVLMINLLYYDVR